MIDHKDDTAPRPFKNCAGCGALHAAHETKCAACRAHAAQARGAADVLGYLGSAPGYYHGSKKGGI